MARILIIDDEEAAARAMQRLLHRSGFPATEIAYSGREGLEKLSTFAPDLVITDYLMNGLNGAHVLDQIRTAAPKVIRVLMSAYMTPKLAIEYARVTPDTIQFFFAKPWNEAQLLSAIHSLLAKRGASPE